MRGEWGGGGVKGDFSWSKCVTSLHIPQPKLGNLEYSSDIGQFSKARVLPKNI